MRRQAHSLRQKLEEYYSHEGAGNPIQIEVPLGHYIPVFRRQSGVSRAGVRARSPRSVSPARILFWAGAAAAALALAFWTGQFLERDDAAAASTDRAAVASPALLELWGPWLESRSGPVVCFSNPLATVVKHFEEAVPTDAPPYRLLASPAEDLRIRQRFNLPDGGHIYLTPSYEAKMGEAMGAVQLTNLFALNGVRVRTTQSRFLSWEDFRRENLVLLGNSEGNRWLEPLLEDYPLQLRGTKGEIPRRIVNTNPASGERNEYHIHYAAEEDKVTHEFALVSMIPGVDGQHRLLLVSGLNTQATLMALEFLTDPLRVHSFLDRLRRIQPDHAGPWHFQLILRTEVRDKVPTSGSIELIRVL